MVMYNRSEFINCDLYLMLFYCFYSPITAIAKAPDKIPSDNNGMLSFIFLFALSLLDVLIG